MAVRANKMKEEIIKNIESFLKELGVENPKVNFDTPAHIELGDRSTNVAMVYAKQLNKKPTELAEEIKKSVEIRCPQIRVDVVAPGFINFFFGSSYFSDNIKQILDKKNSFGKNTSLSGQKIIIEYTDPNPFKEFHIGHMMPNVIGESIARVIEGNGAEVRRANYQGDVGLHVAKAVWAIKNGIDIEKAYAYGHKAYEENDESKRQIVEINKKIYDRSDPEVNDIYEEGRTKSLLYFEIIYKRFGTKFDFYFFESEVASFGKEIVEKNIGTVFEKSDGAVVFKGENFDKKLHTRVFINKESLPTYEAKELGLSKIKYERYEYDTSVVVTGNEINEYFKVLLKAMSMVFPELAQKTKHVSHGMLRLPEGKMSSRTGNVITAESLISEVKEKILMKMVDREMSDDEKKEIAEIVAIGALKYSILRQAIGGDIIFDFDKSISFEGDSGPYLQYATVRANSILKKAEGMTNLGAELPNDWKTTNLERLLERFPYVVERAGLEYAPHHIATHLIDLAGEFNSFYASHKIIDETDSTSPYRLALTKSFVQVMTSGLDLLGIKVPSQM